MKSLRATYVQTIVDPLPYLVPCHNRFAPLTQLDTPVSITQQDGNQSVLQTAYKVKVKVKSTNGSKSQDDGVHKCLELESNLQINEQSHLSPVVIEINKVTTEVKFNALSCNKSQEQDRHEPIQQESELHSLNLFDHLNESILRPLPECTARLGSDSLSLSLTTLQIHTGPPTHNSALNDPLLLHRRVCELCLPNYMGIRVPVATNLNISNCRHFLVDY